MVALNQAERDGIIIKNPGKDIDRKLKPHSEQKVLCYLTIEAVEEIKVELTHLKGTVERLLELSSGTQRDSWMNIDQLRAYHPDHPAKSTIYEWVGQNRIPVHKDGKGNCIMNKERI